MKQPYARRRLTASSLMCGVALCALAAAPARAQTAGQGADQAAAQGEVAEVVVTGSRIPTPNLTSISPVHVVPGREFQLQGRMDVSDLINTLPQNFQNSGIDFSNVSNPLSAPGGVSTVDLRGLGPQRTLVLVDGRRLGIGDANTGNPNPAPDLNQIPAQLVDRIEVLTGGASATYGSDAVAGVVNFIMKHDFDGMQIDAQASVDQHHQHDSLAQGLLASAGIPIPKDAWDGRTRDLSIVMGMNGEGGRGNVTGYFTYHVQDPVSQGARDYSACKINVTPPSGPTTPACNGSPNSNLFTDLNTLNNYSVVGSQFLPYPQAGSNPPALFNSNPWQYLQHQDTRYTAGFFAHYDLNPHAKLYGDFSYMHDRSATQVAPSGQFQFGGLGPSGGDLVNCDNPLLSAQEAATVCTPAQIASGESVELAIGRRAVEDIGRTSRYDHMNYRAVLGVKGDIPDLPGFTYDIYGQYYYTSLYQANDGYLSLTRIARALQVVNVNGTPTCVSVVNGTDPACVPYDIFKDGGVTQAALAYLNGTGTEQGTIAQRTFSATFAGDLASYGIKSPLADAGLGVAGGVETRHEHYVFAPDQASLSGDLSGFGGASTAVDANLGVTDVFAEARVPLIESRPFADQVLIELGYRRSSYTTHVKADTYKLAGQWAPIPDIRLRASFQRAIRAPNIVELYNPQAVTNTSQVSSDPCSGTAAAPATATLEQCQRTGVTPAQYGDGGATNRVPQCAAGQCGVLQGGNPNLQPEKANTYSVGVTFKPRILPGFLGSIDWYDIKLRDQIGQLNLAFILSQCLTTGDPLYCGFIHRGPAGNLSPTTGYIVGNAVNIGRTENSGVDFQGTYDVPLSRFGWSNAGSLSVNFVGTWLLKVASQGSPGTPFSDCAGLFGAECQTVNPRWRHNLRLSWESPWNLLLSAQWRYIGSTKLDSNDADPGLNNGAFDAFDAKLKAVSYLDLTAIWHVRRGLNLRAGVNNVFDKDPQIISSLITGTGSPNAYPTYDLVGRNIFIGLTADF